MRLSNLIASTEGITLHGKDTEITGITADSRDVKPGFLFVAIPGARFDGRNFIVEAIKRGATAVFAPEDMTALPDASLVTASNLRLAISKIASRFYPQQPEMIAAVTGTSGKTSTTQFIREIWQELGHKTASIGTLGLVTKDEERYGSLTTPDAITLHHMLDEITRNGVTHLAMEASSHGLALNRLDNVHVKVGAFTNLSRDHLDYHGTMEDYFAAKQRLFTTLLPQNTGVAILNADAAEFAELAGPAKRRGLKIISYGKGGKEIKLKKVTPHIQGQVLNLEVFGKSQEILLPVIGEFQAWNSLAALGVVIGSGADEARSIAAVSKLTGVPGRIQLAGQTKTGAAIFVDYAHKPDALENVLKALRPHVAAHKDSKLGIIFGCGGNRDAGKRPIMGEIASRLADWVIVTDDNPRHEEPAEIRRAILAGCKTNSNVREIGDRSEAIAAGIAQLGAHDVLIIAGKGHEPGQIVGDITLPFNDAEVARSIIGPERSPSAPFKSLTPK